MWLARGWPRIAHPTLWAEDGPIFLAAAYRNPLHPFIEPYSGYLHTVPRLVALLASPLRLTWLPAVYALAAVAGAVAAAGVVLSPRMRWLLRRRWQPPLAFGLLAVLPAADERFGNIAPYTRGQVERSLEAVFRSPGALRRVHRFVCDHRGKALPCLTATPARSGLSA